MLVHIVNARNLRFDELRVSPSHQCAQSSLRLQDHEAWEADLEHARVQQSDLPPDPREVDQQSGALSPAQPAGTFTPVSRLSWVEPTATAGALPGPSDICSSNHFAGSGHNLDSPPSLPPRTWTAVAARLSFVAATHVLPCPPEHTEPPTIDQAVRFFAAASRR